MKKTMKEKHSREAALGSLRAAELYYLLALGTTMANHYVFAESTGDPLIDDQDVLAH